MKSFLAWFTLPYWIARTAIFENQATISKQEVDTLRSKVKRLESEKNSYRAALSEAKMLADRHEGRATLFCDKIDELKAVQAELQQGIEDQRSSNVGLKAENKRLLEVSANAIAENTRLLEENHKLEIALAKESDKVDIQNDRVQLFEKAVALNHKLVESLIQLTLTAAPNASSSSAANISGSGASSSGMLGDEVPGYQSR